jgi:hypothetical protein
MAHKEGAVLEILVHHHSLLAWCENALKMAKTELKSWYPTISVECYRRDSCSSYCATWRARQSSNAKKTKAFTDQELHDGYFQWIEETHDIEQGVRFGLGRTTPVKVIDIPEGKYLSDFLPLPNVTEREEWDIDCDVHRYQVMTVENVLLQLAVGSCLHHDIDKYGYGDKDRWIVLGFDHHRSPDAPSHHHKENVETVTDLVEMVADWISASHRRSTTPWGDTSQGCVYPFNTDLLIKNTFNQFNSKKVWPYIWIISQLCFHTLYEAQRIKPDFFENFPCDRILEILGSVKEE